MDERTKAIDSAVRNFASPWQTATAAYDAGVAAERERCARTPLTEGQIDEMLGEANRGFYIERDDYIKAVRDAEQAHGIGPNAGGNLETPA